MYVFLYVKTMKQKPPLRTVLLFMKRLAEDEEAVIRVPIVLEDVRVQVTLVAVPVEVRDIAMTVGVGEHVHVLCGSHQDHHGLNESLR